MSKKLQFLLHSIVVFLILLAGFSPLISVAIAGSIASANGCQLDEGSIHPCVVNGQDIGDTLYSMGVMGWFMLVTIPLGIAAAAVYLVLVGGFYLARYCLRRRANGKVQAS